jgi:hypothetical protein
VTIWRAERGQQQNRAGLWRKTVMASEKNNTQPAKTELHAPHRPLAIKAVVAAALMLKRKTLKSA